MPALLFKKVSGIALLIVLAAALCFLAYSKGAEHKKNELTSAYQTAYIAQFEHYKALESQAKERMSKLDAQYTKELFDAQENMDSLLDNLRIGNKRLYVKTRQVRCKPMPKNASSARMDYASGRAELDAEHAARIIAITNRGDKAIRQLGACQAVILEMLK